MFLAGNSTCEDLVVGGNTRNIGAERSGQEVQLVVGGGARGGQSWVHVQEFGLCPFRGHLRF